MTFPINLGSRPQRFEFSHWSLNDVTKHGPDLTPSLVTSVGSSNTNASQIIAWRQSLKLQRRARTYTCECVGPSCRSPLGFQHDWQSLTGHSFARACTTLCQPFVKLLLRSPLKRSHQMNVCVIDVIEIVSRKRTHIQIIVMSNVPDTVRASLFRAASFWYLTLSIKTVTPAVRSGDTLRTRRSGSSCERRFVGVRKLPCKPPSANKHSAVGAYMDSR